MYGMYTACKYFSVCCLRCEYKCLHFLIQVKRSEAFVCHVQTYFRLLDCLAEAGEFFSGINTFLDELLAVLCESSPFGSVANTMCSLVLPSDNLFVKFLTKRRRISRVSVQPDLWLQSTDTECYSNIQKSSCEKWDTPWILERKIPLSGFSKSGSKTSVSHTHTAHTLKAAGSAAIRQYADDAIQIDASTVQVWTVNTVVWMWVNILVVFVFGNAHLYFIPPLNMYVHKQFGIRIYTYLLFHVRSYSSRSSNRINACKMISVVQTSTERMLLWGKWEKQNTNRRMSGHGHWEAKTRNQIN